MEQLINEIHWTSISWCIIAPILLIILDVLTGIAIAWKNDDYKSTIMRAGLSKKFGEIVYIIVGIITKYALGIDIILYFLVGYICVMEISSLAENCDKLGVAMPEKLKSKLNNNSNKED